MNEQTLVNSIPHIHCTGQKEEEKIKIGELFNNIKISERAELKSNQMSPEETNIKSMIESCHCDWNLIKVDSHWSYHDEWFQCLWRRKIDEDSFPTIACRFQILYNNIVHIVYTINKKELTFQRPLSQSTKELFCRVIVLQLCKF
jgi:hypothetical protein